MQGFSCRNLFSAHVDVNLDVVSIANYSHPTTYTHVTCPLWLGKCIISYKSIDFTMSMYKDNFEYKVGPPKSGFSIFLADRWVQSPRRNSPFTECLTTVIGCRACAINFTCGNHRTKTIHFIRHAEGFHNEATSKAGNNDPLLRGDACASVREDVSNSYSMDDTIFKMVLFQNHNVWSYQESAYTISLEFKEAVYLPHWIWHDVFLCFVGFNIRLLLLLGIWNWILFVSHVFILLSEQCRIR